MRKWIGLAAGVISALALVISLSNSLGAMAGRGNEQQATRIQVAETVRDLRRGLESAASERRGLKFEPVDEAAVNAAKAKAAATSAAKEAECKWRSARCRDKETAEAATLAALETATKNKAATDRAAKLDADIAAFREKIEKAGPVLEANSQGNALARLFNLPETKAATLSTYQNLAMALVIELLIVMSMVASEVLEHHETKAPEPEAVTATDAVRAPEKATEAALMAEALSYDEEPKAFPAPPRPRLISSQASPVGSVPVILAEIMEPGRGKIGLLELFSAYADACRGKGNEPVSASEFSHTVAALCERLGIQIEDDDDGVFLMRVKLNSKKKSVKLRTVT